MAVILSKGPANAAAGAGDENNGFHRMRGEAGASNCAVAREPDAGLAEGCHSQRAAQRCSIGRHLKNNRYNRSITQPAPGRRPAKASQRQPGSAAHKAKKAWAPLSS